MTFIGNNQPEWYCVRAQTKREHIAARHLRELGEIEVFCPRLRFRKATRRGKIWWIEPMFPGYLLAKFDLGASERAVTFCQGVRGLVKFGGVIPPVPADFIATLRREVSKRSEDEEIIPLTPEILPGDEVEIASGPFQGMQGAVVSITPAAERVRILLEFLGRPQIADIDLYSILLPRRPQVPIPPDAHPVPAG